MSLLQFLFGAPTSDWLKFAVFFCGISLFIFIAEKTRSALGWPAEVNRKLVHIMTGILIFFCPFFFESDRPLIWMALLFIIINLIGVQTNKLKGMHGTTRHSYGTVFYPMTFLVLVVTCWYHYKVVLMLSMLILALSDAAAAIVGENLKNPHDYHPGRDKKSVEGSATMFLTTFLIVLILLPLIDHLDGMDVTWLHAAWIGIVTAIVATVLESLSSGGSDNLTSPLGAAFILHFMLTHALSGNVQLTIGLCLALITAIVSFKAHFITGSGAMGVFLLATLIFGAGAWAWAVPILTFFVLSSLLSKTGKTYKAQFQVIFEKSGRRDLGQVMANGSVPGLIMIFYIYFPHSFWYYAYLGALAAVTADTWGTEIGLFSKSEPRSIIHFKKVTPGTSGGISFSGTIGALIGSFMIVLSGWLFHTTDTHLGIGLPLFWIIVLCGFTAGFIDSLIGATLQAQYRCPRCQKMTEKRFHCEGNGTLLVSGLHWLNNDWVNGFCSVSGAFLVWIGYQVFVS